MFIRVLGLRACFVTIAFFGISSCQVPIGEGDANSSVSIVSTAESVRRKSVEACSFAPSLTAVAVILGVPGAPKADKLVESICQEIELIPALESFGGQPRNIIIEIPEGRVDGVLNPPEA